MQKQHWLYIPINARYTEKAFLLGEQGDGNGVSIRVTLE